MTYGNWLAAHRLEAGLTQEQLGDLVGVTGTYINRVENRRVKMPYLPLRTRIHRVLGTSDLHQDVFPLLTDEDRRLALTSEDFHDVSLGDQLNCLTFLASPGEHKLAAAMVRMIRTSVLSEVRD